MRINKLYVIGSLMAIGMITLQSCLVGEENLKEADKVVINELMASNRTGILSPKGKAADWIELKNTSNDTINLKGFQLSVEKIVNDTVAKKAKKTLADEEADPEKEVEKEEKETVTTWTFPSVKIPAGGTILVFSGKKKDKEDADSKNASKDNQNDVVSGPLISDLKFPKEGGIVRFLSPKGKVIKELKYGALKPDQALALQPDSTYKTTYWQSPGFENTKEGYIKVAELIDTQRNSPLLIWELMSRMPHSYQNWVELKNVSDKDVDLSQYSLSKKLGKKDGVKLPARILKPGEIISLTLAGEKRANGALSVPLKLGDAETLVLSKDGKFMDGVCAKSTTIGGSIGRAEGKKGFFYYTTPSRNASNGEGGRRLVADKPQFDNKPAVYQKNDKITLRLKDPNQVVHYTTNGTAPTAASPVLKDSIVVSKNTVVRTFAEGDSLNIKSDVATATYIIGASHDLPVMNITVNNSDLYDYNTGIYADGPGYGDEWPHKGANFWKDWTKNAYVEFFDDKDGFSVDCGLKIFGGFSRNEPKKSFRLKFRGEYGDSEVDYDFFGDGEVMGLKDLVLRSGSQDYNRCMVRDEFFTSLMQAQSPTILTQKYRPVALYVNGEYFGLYFLREKIDKNFVARKLNLPNDDINIIMSKGYNEEGPKTEYINLMNYVSTHDMKDKANYEYMKKNVDLQGLIDYKLGEIYASNSDVGNIRYVRSTHPKSDKMWRFVFYDLDATWVGYKPTPAYYLSVTGGAAESNVTEHNKMINRLLENPEFRQMFLERLSYHLTNTFSTKNTTAVFDKLVDQIRPEMKLNCQRWPQLKYETWEKNVEAFKEKFKDKNKVMLDGIREYLKITPDEEKKYFSKLGY
ncbi:MAG: CotH kinase family protein [Muribaculaceae bacterium]|nr:CotH kinase family protein [Muribaculaceae bacterium]